MNRNTSSWPVRGLYVCLMTLLLASPLAEARTPKTLTERTQLRPVGWKEGNLWFAPGGYWVDDFDGGVQSGTLDETRSLTIWNTKTKLDFGPGFIRFEQTGGVKEGTLVADTVLNVVNTASNSKQSLTFSANTTVEFGYDGGVMKGTLAKEATLKSESGESKAYPPGTLVDFTGAGLLSRAVLPTAGPAVFDGLYTGTCTLTLGDIDPELKPMVDPAAKLETLRMWPLVFPFDFKAAKGSFQGGFEAELLSLQWQGNYDAKGGIVNGILTGWVDFKRGDEKVRCTVRGPIKGILAKAASRGTFRATSIDPFATVTGVWGITKFTPPAAEQKLYANWNIGGVGNKPTQPTRFTVRKSCVITYINDYHWNSGRGTRTPGQISIRHEDGTIYGPWQATGAPGQGGVPNAVWECRPNVEVKEGTYTVIDSDPASWAQNAESGGQGFTEVRRESDEPEPKH